MFEKFSTYRRNSAFYLSRYSSLGQLELGYNYLSGNIPTELAKMKKLQKLDLSHNQLSGSLPTKFGSLVDLSEFLVAHFKIVLRNPSLFD